MADWANIFLHNCQHFNCSTSFYLISCQKVVIDASYCGHPSKAIIKLSSSTPFQTTTQYSLLVVLMVSEPITQAIAPPIFSTSPPRHGLKGPTWPTVDIITHAVWSLMRLQEVERLLWLGVGMDSVRVAADIFKMWRFSIWILSSGGMVRRKWRIMPPATWYGIYPARDNPHVHFIISATEFPKPIARHTSLYKEDTFLIMGGLVCNGCNACSCSSCLTSDTIYQWEILIWGFSDFANWNT